MNTPCPEELLERARRQFLSPAERARLEAHLSHCEACSLELQWGAVFDRTLGERAGDDIMASRVANRVLRRWQPRRRRSTRSARRIAWMASAAAIMALATMATAALWHKRASIVPRPSASLAPIAPQRVARVQHDAIVPVAIAPPPLAPPAAPVEPVTNRSLGRASPTPLHRDSHPVSAADAPTPSQLFARANDARHRGELQPAVGLYRTLERQYPNAAESAPTHVVLGRLLLTDGVNDPSGALAQFDSYLAASPHGTLVEEALRGRARALDRLGRSRDALEAWRTVLERFPNSIYSAHARQRLGDH